MLRLREIFDRFYPRLVEWLERFGVPRRWPPLLIVGIAAALASVVIATVLLIDDRTGAGNSPVTIEPAAAMKDGAAVVHAKLAQVQSIAMVTRNRWAAGWADCGSGPKCRYSAVIDRDGDKAVAPEWPVPYVTLRAGDEAIAVAPPPEGTLTGDQTVIFRQTYDSPVTSRLRYTVPTRTFQPGEILTDQIVPGRIVVVNPDDSTVRMLEGPGTRSPVCDGSDRCWMLTGIGRTDIVWTDDGGKTWGEAPLDEHNQRGRLTVSPDGRTLVATSVTIDIRSETVAAMRISTDRGTHWTTVRQPPFTLNGPPVALDGGTAVMLGGQAGHPTPRLYRITDGTAEPVPGLPGAFIDLDGDAKLLYGPRISGQRATDVAVTTDRGTTWTDFSPR